MLKRKHLDHSDWFVESLKSQSLHRLVALAIGVRSNPASHDLLNDCVAQRIWALRAFAVGNRMSVVIAIKTALRPFATAIVLAHSAAARAQAYAGDPAGSGPIVGAIRWIQGTLLGTVATVVAVIAVASIGFMMLTGRMNWRYGATVILGCFILFGAASIVAGIQSSASVGY